MQFEQTRPSIGICFGLTLVLLTGAANAQEDEFEPHNDITKRARPGYDAIGVPLGSWTLFPQLGVGGFYSDNVFADDEDEQDDVAGLFVPSLRLTSETEGYKADVGASSDIARYDEYTGEDYEDSRVWAIGGLKAGSVGWIDANVGYDDLHQLRTSTDDVLGSDLTKYSRTAAYLAYTHNPGSVFARIGGHVVTLHYDDTNTPTGPIDNNDRDETTYDIALRVGYQVAPDYLTFAEIRYDESNFDEKVDDNGFERGTHGGEARVGLMLDPIAVVSGEVYVGYLKQKYEEASFSDTKGPSYGGDLVWNVSRLTSLTMTGDRSVDTTTVAGSSGILKSRVGIAIDHELRRNILLNAEVAFTREDFEDIGRQDDVVRVGIGGDYLMNRYLKLRLGYSYQERATPPGDETGREYKINEVFIRLIGEI